MNELLIKNGLTVEGNRIDLTINAGKITSVGAHLDVLAKEIIDLKGESFISAGWIDGHVHCYEKMDLYYDFPDKIGVERGVTTVVDAGSTGAKNVGDFYELAKAAKTNVFALLNISETGIVHQNELADLSHVRADSVSASLEKYPEFIIGIKARMSASVIGDSGNVPLKIAKKIQHEHGGLPLMVHIGSAPLELEEIFENLEAGDIITHCFNGKANGIMNEKKEIKEFVWDAYNKGIIFDVGHGSESFDFEVAEVAFGQHLLAETISTDIYHRNREKGPVYDLATTVEKMLVVGYKLPDIIEKITSKPAEYLKLTTKGHLKEGYDADITIFKIAEEVKELVDSKGNLRHSNKKIVPLKTIIGGQIYDINEL